MGGLVLGVESSCDETALAVFDPAAGLAGEWVASQIDLHAEYGGVVPELASREHLAAFGPLLREVWAAVPPASVGSVAVTAGPGLAACLAMGVTVARALGLALGAGVTPVNHLRGHVLSPWIPVHASDPAGLPGRLRAALPHLGLIVSGGNTQLFRLGEDGGVRVLAETGDDAAGEALDKGAKLLGLGYPGGPHIERLAASGDPSAFPFPRAIPGREDRRFSFSGLKTALRNLTERLGPGTTRDRLPDLCASYQAAVVESLVRKAAVELEDASFASIGLSGGVANNRLLRAQWERLGARFGLPALAALPRHTGDNAAMIAFAAWVDARVFGLDPARTIEGGAEGWEIAPAWRLEG